MADLSDVIEVQATVLATEALKVYQVQPAPPAIAGWLQRHFRPVIKACRFEGPVPPIELRPTGAWGGWMTDASRAPDRRVAISSRIVLYTRTGLTDIVVHEWAHQLLDRPGHDAAFFSTNLMLLRRVETADPSKTTAGDLALRMSLYDLQDLPEALEGEPDAGLGAALRWAVIQADELAPSNLGAEAAAKEISTRYAAWLAELEAAPAKREAAVERRHQVLAAHADAKRQVGELRAQLRERTWWLVGVGACTVLMAFGMLKLALP
jgi:hypothetical protein